MPSGWASASASARTSTRCSGSGARPTVPPLRVLAFGTYQRDYPRNAQVRSALQRAGATVLEHHLSVWEGRRAAWSAGATAVARLALAEARLALASGRLPPADVLLVGYPGHADVPAARLAARGRPVVLDPLVSLHDTLVDDRGRFRPGSLAARTLAAIDRAALRGADLVVADTQAQASFYAERFGVAPERLRVCFVGAEDRLFRPLQRPGRAFHALFVGKLIPLHGLETILAAARLAPELPFRIVGSGQLASVLHRRPPNVEHVPWVAYERLPALYAAAGCALGIFGASPKALRVIPNKAYQALACATPLVTADSPAARELLRDGIDALLVPPGDPGALAAAVRRLAGDPPYARSLGRAGRQAYERLASEEVLGARWRALLEELIAS